MARVYGRVQVQGTADAFHGEIMFEPRQLAYLVKDQMFANFCYSQQLDSQGKFDVDVFPGEYFVYLDQSKMEVTVPAVNEVTLRELLKVRYQQ